MLPFFRPKNDKDIGDKLVGKQKKYRLARNGSAVAVTGTLLAYYRRDVLPDDYRRTSAPFGFSDG